MKPTEKQIDEFLSRGVSEVIDREALKKTLLSGKQISLYFGVDPTGQELHVGHALPLRKLKKLQQWGHKIRLLIGDFTAMIGDPTGCDQARVPLTSEQVLDNARSYQEQASLLLDFYGDNPIELVYNSTWLAKLSFGEVIDLAANFTVQQMLERDMFQKRLKEQKPISLHEFFYPLMQGYDSVVLDVDLEVGGSDQLFNMLAGRTLMHKLKGKEKQVMTMDLILGSDGRKMSKSFKNHIPLTADPADMYGRVMSIKDELIIHYFELCTDVSMDEIEQIKKQIEGGANPRDAKMRVAREIVTMYHSEHAAQQAEQAFINQFQKGGIPDEMEEHKVSAVQILLIDLLVESGLCSSKSDARRQIEQGAVHFKEDLIKDVSAQVSIEDGDILQKGKRGWRKLRV